MSDLPQGKVVQIDFEPDEAIEFSFASNMLINFDNENFYIRFFQITPPPILGSDMPDSIKAKLVAGVVIPASRMAGVLEALADNYKTYNDRVRQSSEFGLDDIEGLKDNE